VTEGFDSLDHSGRHFYSYDIKVSLMEIYNEQIRKMHRHLAP
jgi:hypothetical protein